MTTKKYTLKNDINQDSNWTQKLQNRPVEATSDTAIGIESLHQQANERSKSQPLLQKLVKKFQGDSKEFRELIINSEPLEKRVALLINGVLEKFEVERTGEDRLVGAIFKGKVQNLEPGLKAAFIDIGETKNAFLHYWDILPTAGDAGVEIVRENRTETQKKSQQKITLKDIPHLYPIGTDIIVQVTKGQIGTKGPRTTTNIALPGRYLVLMPYSGQCGISRKIEDFKERDRLKKILGMITIPPGMGIIVRTAGEGKKIRYFIRDLYILLQQWDTILNQIEGSNQPCCVYTEPDLIQRTVRDFLTEEIDRVQVDAAEDYAAILESVGTISPVSRKKISLFKESIPIFERFNIERQIEQTFMRRVPLPSGGEVVIEETEALTSIDVNTGSHKLIIKDGKDFIVQVNLEAAREITRQIRLRNIGGVIIIDFIDMKSKRDRKAVLDCVQTEMDKDKAKNHVLPLSQLGIMQLTRQRHQESISSGLYGPCPCCNGKGVMKTERTLSVEIQRKLISIIRRLRRKVEPTTVIQLRVLLHPQIFDRLRHEDESTLQKMESTFNVELSFRTDAKFHLESFKIINVQTDEEVG